VAKLDRNRVGLFGFSRGGYTGLVVIGGNPDFHVGFAYMCPPESTTPKCEQLRQNKVPTEPLAHDPRIKVAIIADPIYAIFFTPDGLKDVAIPVQLWRSALGGDGVVPEAVDALYRKLPARPDYHLVANSSHFSFIAPCLPEQAKAFPTFCADPPGFDRTAFHKEFDGEVLAFLRKYLVEANRP
jgi:predicted dienelactone hydrolase